VKQLIKPFFIIILSALSIQIGAAPKISDNHSYKHLQTGVTIVGASITLPSEGVWSIANVNNSGLSDLLLEPPELIKLRNQGIREIKKNERRERNKNRYLLDRMYRHIERSARENEGKTIQNIDLLMADNRFKANEITNVFLIPANVVEKNGKRWRRVKDKKPPFC